MKFVDNIKDAWKWFSMHAFALIIVLPAVWVSLPTDAKEFLPDSLEPWVLALIAAAGALGRIVDQTKK